MCCSLSVVPYCIEQNSYVIQYFLLLQVIANRYGVRAIPVFLFFRNGERIHTVKGADMGSLDAAITQHLAGAISTQPSGGAEAPKVPGQVNHLNNREPSQAELNE